MTDEKLTLEKVQQMVTRAPYHQWLGLKVMAFDDTSIELKATWREEWVVNPDRRYTHGGILAALVDLAADWAMLGKLGRGVLGCANGSLDDPVFVVGPRSPAILAVRNAEQNHAGHSQFSRLSDGL